MRSHLLLLVMVTSAAACRTSASPTQTVDAPATADSDAVRVPVSIPTIDPAWPHTYHALAYDPDNAETLWFTYGRGMIRNQTGGTGEWSAIESTDTGGPLLYQLTYPASDMLVTGGRGVFRVSRDAGATWEPVAELGDAQVKGLTSLPGSPGALFALVDGRGVVRSDDGMSTWTDVGPFPAELAFGLWVARAEPLRLLSFDRGALSLMASDDGGSTWSVLATDALTADVSAVALSSDGTAYAATSQGLYATTDGGDSWAERGEAPPLLAVAVSPNDQDEITAIDDRGRVFQSTDGGTTW